MTFSWLSVLAFLQFVISIRIGLTRSRKRLGRASQFNQDSQKPKNTFLKEVILQLCGASVEDAEEQEVAGRAYGRISRVDHISFDIEEQERILR